MRRSTSPVGPLIAIALLCVTYPARADDLQAQPGGNAPDVAAHYGGALRGSVEASAWSFLETQPSIQVEDLPPPATPTAGLDGTTLDKPLTAEERDRLAATLLSDPRTAPAGKATLRSPKIPGAKTNLEVTRTDLDGGVKAVNFNKPIVPNSGNWKAKLGADLGMAPDAGTGWSPDNPLRVQRNVRGANAAWASVDVHEVATVDARVNPASEQGVLATTFKKSLPIGSHLSMTLQSRTAMTETYGRGVTSFDIPMMTLPSSDGTTTSRVWGQENLARFKILATGTTLGAGVSTSSTDPVAHNSLSAEQKLYGPLSVSTAVNDVGQPGESRSVSARARFSW